MIIPGLIARFARPVKNTGVYIEAARQGQRASGTASSEFSHLNAASKNLSLEQTCPPAEALLLYIFGKLLWEPELHHASITAKLRFTHRVNKKPGRQRAAKLKQKSQHKWDAIMFWRRRIHSQSSRSTTAFNWIQQPEPASSPVPSAITLIRCSRTVLVCGWNSGGCGNASLKISTQWVYCSSTAFSRLRNGTELDFRYWSLAD